MIRFSKKYTFMFLDKFFDLLNFWPIATKEEGTLTPLRISMVIPNDNNNIRGKI